MLKYHPDKNPDKQARKRFQEVQTAFDVLNDPKKRELYDRYGSAFETMGAGGPRGGPRGAGPGAGPGGFGNYEDIDFGQFFGERFGGGEGIDLGDILAQFSRGGRARRRGTSGAGRRRGSDAHHDVEIPFTMAVTGGEIEIALDRGTGHVDRLRVKIPPGIEEGKKIRLRGQGEPAGPGRHARRSPGRRPHRPASAFPAEGQPAHGSRAGNARRSGVGGENRRADAPGDRRPAMPPGTSSGTKLRIKGRGVAPKNGPAGDLLAEIMIVLPKELDETARDLIRQFDEHERLRGAADPRANLRW